MNSRLTSHRCHDSVSIIRRWRKVAQAARLTLRTLYVTPSGFPVLWLETKRRGQDAIYLSAGVHGDEPAPVAALLEWAEENIALLRSGSFVIVPLFNPAGLRANTRSDEFGLDLNRAFHDITHPHLSGWHHAVQGWKFRLGLMLHEDYDAQGVYAYELSGRSGLTTDAMLQAASKFIPRDQRRNIDGFSARNGVIKKTRIPRLTSGLPEALVLYRGLAQGTFTVETPSEFSITDRVDAHRAVLDSLTQLQSSV